MKIKVMPDHVLLAPRDATVTAGGIAIPDAHQDDLANREGFIRDSNQFAKARVVAVYERRWTDDEGWVSCDVEVGKWVLYRRAEAAPFDLRDPQTDDGLVIVHEESCLGYVDENVSIDRVTNRDKDGT